MDTYRRDRHIEISKPFCNIDLVFDAMRVYRICDRFTIGYEPRRFSLKEQFSGV
jgi:hypothetical protein